MYDRLICQHWLKREPRPRELVLVARLSNVLILVIALVVMANLGSIQTAWFISLLFGAGMGSVLVLRWLWERINLYSELAAMGVSLITAPLLLILLGTDVETEWLRLLIMATATTAAAIGITFVTPRTDKEILVSFYERVQPFGWWHDTARSAGDRPSAPLHMLWRRGRAALVCGASLFLLLIGFGRLLISPPEASAAWTWGFIIVGLAFVPFWWRDLTGTLEIDRSARPEDVQVADDDLAVPVGAPLPVALRQLATHMMVAHGMNVQVDIRPGARTPAPGQRVLLYQAIQDVLLFMARPGKCRQARVALYDQDGFHTVEVDPLACTVDFGAQEALAEVRAAHYDVLEHLQERLYQVAGHLRVEPDRRSASRITMTAAIET